MATDMERACDDDGLVNHRCDGCGGVLEPWDAEPPVIYDCFHALHATCAAGRDACPRCDTPRRVHDDDDQPEQVEEVAAAAAASPPVPGSASDGCCCACACSRRVAELERRLEKCGLTESTTTVLQAALERDQSRLRRIEEMYKKLEEMYEKLEKFVRLCGGKRAREIEDAEETRKKPREDGGSRKEERSWFPTGPDRLNQRRLFHGGLFSYQT